MRIEDIMSRNVLCVDPRQDASSAWAAMNRKGIHHLVVTRDAVVVGVVSERDLGGPHGEEVRRGKTVGDLMTALVLAVSPDTSVRKAAKLMRGQTIGCLPVIDGKQLVGIVTVTDLLALVARGVSSHPAPRATNDEDDLEIPMRC